MLSRTVPPEMMQPPATSELSARPTRSPDSWTNFAGGLYSSARAQRPLRVVEVELGVHGDQVHEASWYASSVPTSRQ